MAVHDGPADAAQATRRLAQASVPGEIFVVARRLQKHGHQAVLVGGAVRDTLLGMSAEDWDLATSATPNEVQELFTKTIPTGIEHGTITVLVRGRHISGAIDRSAPMTPVEVTTFRGEAEYVDGRRPSSVTFLRDLHEDLARRDFTVNAFAWDPVREVFSDPFDGLTDLRSGRIRAVGDPAERFAEDGLRTMRAVRLCATRGFELDPPTEAAIEPALPVLDKVSRERVHVELTKMLAAPRPSRGLAPMVRTGMWKHVLPELEEAQQLEAVAAVDRMQPDPVVRLARLLWPLIQEGDAGRQRALASVDALRPSRNERRRVQALLSEPVSRLATVREPPEIRRAVAELGREHLDDALDLLGLDGRDAGAIRKACEGAPLSVGELDVKGRDLIEAGIVKPGKHVGELLRKLLEACLDDPTKNRSDTLVALARDSGSIAR